MTDNTTAIKKEAGEGSLSGLFLCLQEKNGMVEKSRSPAPYMRGKHYPFKSIQ
jgi:hypothetical protein